VRLASEPEIVEVVLADLVGACGERVEISVMLGMAVTAKESVRLALGDAADQPRRCLRRRPRRRVGQSVS